MISGAYRIVSQLLCIIFLLFGQTGLSSAHQVYHDYDINLRPHNGSQKISGTVSMSLNLACANAFGGSGTYAQNSITASGTSSSIQVLQNTNCALTIANINDGTSTYTPISSSLVSSTSKVSSSGMLTNPPAYNAGSSLDLYLFLVSSTSTSLAFEYIYDPTVITSSVVIPVTCPNTAGTPSTISTTFNGTTIARNRFIWFSANFDGSTIPSTLTHVYVKNSTIAFTTGGTNYSITVPDSVITFDPNASCGSTSFTSGAWNSTMPPRGNSEVFLAGVGFPVPVNFPSSIWPVRWQLTLSSDNGSITSLNWKWGAAIYSTNMTSYSTLGVKSATIGDCNNVLSTIHAGTPVSKILSTAAGATGGGTNYTGSFTSASAASVGQCIN